MIVSKSSLTHRLAARAMAAIFVCVATSISKAQTEAEVTFGNLTQPYTGTAKYPAVYTNPGGLSVDIALYPRASTTVFSNIPSPLDLSYSGTPLGSYMAFGDVFQLGGTFRNLESVDVVLVNWARASDWPDLAASNPRGYLLPITVIVHQASGPTLNSLTYVTQKTQNFVVPWRPETLDDGSPYPWNGTAFKARFNFPLGTTLSNAVALSVSFNNRLGGFSPTGVAGPADQLNVPLRSIAPSIGSNPNGTMLRYTSTTPSLTNGYGAVSPMFEVRTMSATPPTAVPLNAGHYAIHANVSSPGYTGSGIADMVITPAPATITLGNLKQAATGTPKSISVTTVPAGLSHVIVYDGLTGPPSATGKYPVTVEINAPNYQGRTSATLVLGTSFETFLQPWINAGLTETGPNQDPDRDGSSNLLEYAFGTNPDSGSEIATLKISQTATHSLLTFSRQRDAIDLTYEIQASSDLGNSSEWVPLTYPLSLIPPSGTIETVQMQVPESAENYRFFRLKVTHATP